jgi:hypothetical protein
MTDDILKTFRSEMPVPDDQTTQQIYERATSGRRRLATRNRLVAVAAVLALAGLAGGLTAAFTGGGSPKPWKIESAAGGASGKLMLNPLSTTFTADGNEYSAIDVSLLSMTATSLEVRVVRSDAADVADADSAPNSVVFDEQGVTTDSSNPEDTYTTWSGTLTPSEWNGGCQQALYRIEYHFGDSDLYGSSGWFQCSGPKVDAANPFLYAQVPAGPTDGSGAAG